MIEYTNIKQFTTENAADYFASPELSHSYLKRQKNGILPEMSPSDKMKMGSLVDAILTEHPSKVDYNSPFYPAAVKIANKINEKFGPILTIFKKQICYTADVSYTLNGTKWTINTKARLDYVIPKKIVLDLKFTTVKNVRAVIEHFGYLNQLWHYARCAEAKDAYILAYIQPLDQCQLIKIPLETENIFWMNMCVDFGTPIAA